MSTGKLTKRTVDTAVAGARDHLIWDTELRGFGLKVTPSGGRIYLLQYRMGGRGSPTRRATIGKHGDPWTPTAARSEAERLKRLVATGIDPQATAQETRRSDGDLAFDRYAKRFLETYGKPRWAPRHYASAESNMRRWIVPVLGKRPLTDLKRRDVVAVLDGLPPTSPALARSVFALLSKMLKFAQEEGAVERSPLEGMKRPPAVASRERVLSDAELRVLLAGAELLGRPFAQFVRLLVITGQRREEVAALRWEELDRDRAGWLLPAGRAKNRREHYLPLSSLALIELDDAAGGKQWPKQGLVFSTTGRTPISGHSRVKARLDRIMARNLGISSVVPWRIHDIRRTVATNLQKLDVRFEVTEAILNHVGVARSGVAAIYQRYEWAPEKQEAMDAWAKRLRGIVYEDEEREQATRSGTNDIVPEMTV